MKKGFTLIELIFVIVIIGLLAAVAVPKFLATKKNAETANFPEVAQQFVNKANEQYNLIQVSDLKTIVNSDSDLQRYMEDINATALFDADVNSTEFNVSFQSTGEVCLRVERIQEDVNISSSAKVSAYNFTISELNTSCNSQ